MVIYHRSHFGFFGVAHLHQISQVGCMSNLMAGPYGQKIIPDNAIYTTLPGSDCESQPYTRVSNGSSLHGHSKLTDHRLSCANYMEPGMDFSANYLTVGRSVPPLPPPNGLIHSTLLPPPPSLPLPPIPVHHFSSSPSQGSIAQTPDDDLADSGADLLSNDHMQMLTTSTSPHWIPQTPTATNVIWLSRGGNHMEQLSNFQAFSGSFVFPCFARTCGRASQLLLICA